MVERRVPCSTLARGFSRPAVVEGVNFRLITIYTDCPVCVKRRARQKSDKQTRLFVCLFVRCVCQGRPSYGWTKRDASQKFKGARKAGKGVKILDLH